jgi:sterol desaturase/sphingolipid hydroxylase (fatty acid hydroxylase superfamily)
MHGIHHSEIEEQTNTNWASLFTCWDMLHRTFLYDVPDQAITIGAPGWKGQSDVSLGKLLALPFSSRPAEAGPA